MSNPRLFPVDSNGRHRRQLTRLTVDGKKAPLPLKAAAIFDRGLVLTPEQAMSAAGSMRVGVVGNSGTGSLVAELLVRAGFGEVVLFDFDHTDIANLNRVLHSRMIDAEKKSLKSARLKEALDELGMPTIITVVPGGDIRNESVAAELRRCDAIVGCVDNSDWARLIMTEVSYQYLIPYIDIGTEIGVGENHIQSLDSRVSYLRPDRPCLLCSGLISLERVRLEGLASEELQRVLAMGYAKNRTLTAPAVMDLNMRAASYGVLVLRHLLQPFLDMPLPTHIIEPDPETRDATETGTQQGTSFAVRDGVITLVDLRHDFVRDKICPFVVCPVFFHAVFWVKEYDNERA